MSAKIFGREGMKAEKMKDLTAKIFKARNLILILPLMIWLYFIRVLYPGELIIVDDTRVFFHTTKYFLENIMRGVYPLWDPFHFWGRPDDLALRYIGEFNPWLFLIAFLHGLGFSFSFSYFIYQLSYYLIGVAGFYCLARMIFADELLAYLAATLLLFSTFGVTFFNDIAVVLIFVAAVWFFYFLMAFTKKPSQANFLGLTLATMMIAVTYLPLYFLTIFLTFLLLHSVLYFRDYPVILQRYWTFIKKHPFLVCFGLFSLGLSMFPGILWFLSASGGGDYFVGWRHTGSPLSHMASLSYKAASGSGIMGPFTFLGLFSDLQDIGIVNLYIPVFAFLLGLMGMMARITRRQILLLALGTFLILIAMVYATPIHPFLYKHVGFFRYFRNLRYLLWLSIPVLVLFVVETFRQLKDYRPSSRSGRWLVAIFVLLVHGGFLLFLSGIDNVIFTTYVTVFVSALFFLTLLVRPQKPRAEILKLALLLCIVIQPLEVFSALGSNSKDLKISYEPRRFIPRFSYVRPALGEDRPPFLDQNIPPPKDYSGFPFQERGKEKFIGVKWTYLLQQAIPQQILKNYVKYKFVLYDHVTSADDTKENLVAIGKALAENRNVAFVVAVPQNDLEKFPEQGSDLTQAQKITGNTAQFSVLSFDVNRITLRTNFPKPKWLVYNDSFHRGWRARLNGKAVLIYRSNVAFKGLFLPAGENVLELSFASPWRYIFSFGLFVYIAVLMGYFVVAGIREIMSREITLRRI